MPPVVVREHLRLLWEKQPQLVTHLFGAIRKGEGARVFSVFFFAAPLALFCVAYILTFRHAFASEEASS